MTLARVGTMVAPPDAGASIISVEVVTVDGVCAALGRAPDWIRIDVQGLECASGAVVRYEVDPREATDRFADCGLRAETLEGGPPVFEQSAHVMLRSLQR